MVTRREVMIVSIRSNTILRRVLAGMILLLMSPDAIETVVATAQRGRILKMIEPVTIQQKPVLHREWDRNGLQVDDQPITAASRDSQYATPHTAILDRVAVTHPLDEVCLASSPCELCTDSDRESIPECLETGRQQSFVCTVQEREVVDGTEEEESTSTQSRTIHKSCARTVDDEEFLLVRFQVLCFLTGGLAFFSVRKQKAAAASLFDQRKMNLQNKRRISSDNMNYTANNTNNNSSVEMTSVQLQQATSNGTSRQEETKALMSGDDDDMDIV